MRAAATESLKFAVYLGSRFGAKPAYRAAATATGEVLAARGHSLVYGGAAVGLMGLVADAALAGNAKVHGVLPHFLGALDEVAHSGLTSLEMVEDMHTRKARMLELADRVLLLPGGIGSYEEFFEAISWGALDLHNVRVGVLNVEGFFDPLISLLSHGVDEGFIAAPVVENLVFASEAEDVIRQLETASVLPPSLIVKAQASSPEV